MDLYLQGHLANAYTSGLQRARVTTEPWVASQIYCPNCGNCQIIRYANNNEVGDFYCPACKEDYELKSQRSRFGAKVVEGAYPAMVYYPRGIAWLGSGINTNVNSADAVGKTSGHADAMTLP